MSISLFIKNIFYRVRVILYAMKFNFLCISFFSFIQIFPTNYTQAQNPLNNVGINTNASAAFSFRRLANGYTGPVVRVRRSTDNAEVDVAFDASNETSASSIVAFIPNIVLLNTSAFTAKTGILAIVNGSNIITGTGTNFTTELSVGDVIVDNALLRTIGTIASITDATTLTITAAAPYSANSFGFRSAATPSFGVFYAGATTNCHVKIWYDQSGSVPVNNAIQNINTAQPLIVENGAIKLVNGKPILIWNSTAQFLESDVSTIVQTVNAVRNLNTIGYTTHQTLFASPKNDDFSIRYGYLSAADQTGKDWVFNPGITPLNWVNGVQTMNGTKALHTLTATAAASRIANYSLSTTFSTNRGLTGNIGISEIILFPGLLGASDKEILECNQLHYFSIINSLLGFSNQAPTICSGKVFNASPAAVFVKYTWSAPVISPAGAVTGASAQVTPISTCSQTLTNITNAPATVTYSVTPALCGVPATPFTITVTVNPLPTIIPTISANYCVGNGFVQLTSTAGTGYLWSTGQTTKTINVANSGVYTVATSQNPYGCASTKVFTVEKELVVNGNFEQGNTGFKTLYNNNQSSLIVDGTYAVAPDARTLHFAFNGKDHTTGTGNFMIVNGMPSSAKPIIWADSNIAVQPNTTYYFSAWGLSLQNVNNAVLQFSVNGFQTGSIAYLTNGWPALSGPFVWVRFFGQWNSGPATVANISIVNLNPSSPGNDFGLDDISFGTLSPVSLAALPMSNSGTAACQSDTLYLNSNVIGGASPYSYLWTGPNSFSSTEKTPIISYSANAVHNGIYSLKVTDGFGCQVNANTSINITPLPADKLTSATATPLCVGGSSGILLQASDIGVSYQLRNALNINVGASLPGNGSDITLPAGVLNITNTYSVIATTDNNGCSFTMSNPVTVTISTTPVLKITNQSVCSLTVNLTLAPVTAGSTGGGTLSYWMDAAATTTLPTPTSINISGTYFIRSTVGSCSDIEPVVVSINSNPSAAFSYAGSPYCSNMSNPFPIVTGVAGTFSSTPGLVFVSTSTGEINLAASTSGTYGIRNTVACKGASWGPINIVIKAIPKPGFSYGATNDLCQSANLPNQAPTLVDPATYGMGSFFTTPNFSFANSIVGSISVASHAPGNYAVWRVIPAAGGCPAVTDTVFVDINPYINSGTVFTGSSDSTICNGASINLYATPLPYLSVLFRERFNSNGLSWIKTNNSTGGTPSLASWTSRAHSYNDGSSTHNSNDNSSFFYTGSILQGAGSITETILKSVSLSTIGFSSLKLDFFHYFKMTSNGIATVEVSTNNATWTSILTFNTTQGANNAFVNRTVNLDAYIGNANFYIRFKYNAQFDGSWAIDNISLTGNTTNYTYAWSSFPAGFTSSASNPVATPSVNSFYALNAINSYGCSQPAVSVPISVFATQTLSNIQQPAIACIGNGTTITLNGLVPGNTTKVSYSINGIAQTPVSGVVADASGVASFTSSTLTAANNGQTLMVTALDNGSCVAVFSKSLIISIQTQITWSGTISTNWFDAQNWCGGLPTTSTNIVIPSGLSIYPILIAGTGSVKDITIQSNASLVVNNGKLNISGAITNAGIFNALSGTIEMNGAGAQSISGSSFTTRSINSLRVSNTSASGLTISSAAGDTLKIIDSLSFGASNSTLNTGNNLVLLSTLVGTVRVADITNKGLNTGNNIYGLVTVQRFIPGLRSWRLITSPLNPKGTTATIFSQWQNNGIYTPGIGTFITGPAANNATNGLDPSPNNSFSLRTFKNNVFVNIGNTLVPLADTTINSAANYCYFMFVRGDRNPLNFNLSNFNTTTLISKGKLQYGPQTFPGFTRTAIDGLRYYALVGNPYASPVDFNLLTRVNLIKRFLVWDPRLGTVGAFVTFDDLNNDGIYTSTEPFGYVGSMGKNIQSGQAFMVETDAAVGPSGITFNETNKTAVHNINVFRPANPTSLYTTFKTSLYFVNADNSTKLVDGNLAEFDDSFDNSVDLKDAMKFANINENFSLLRNKASIAMERREPISGNDTLFFNLSRTTQRNYRFAFQPAGFNPGIIAFLEDNYLGTKTMLSLLDISIYDFNVSGDIKSATANRFRVVFTTLPLEVVPVTFKTIRAYKQALNIIVEWVVENEININKYEIEKSVDGINFEKVNTTFTSGANRSIANYNWLDNNPKIGNNYYRIRSVSIDGKYKYSSIVTVKQNNDFSGIRIVPNPVTNGIIGLAFTNLRGGIYLVRVLKNNGQTIIKNIINHVSGNSMEFIRPKYKMNTGIYQIEITTPDKTITYLKVIVK